MMDAMAPVTILSQFFQTENVDLALVKVMPSNSFNQWSVIYELLIYESLA